MSWSVLNKQVHVHVFIIINCAFCAFYSPAPKKKKRKLASVSMIPYQYIIKYMIEVKVQVCKWSVLHNIIK